MEEQISPTDKIIGSRQGKQINCSQEYPIITDKKQKKTV